VVISKHAIRNKDTISYYVLLEYIYLSIMLLNSLTSFEQNPDPDPDCVVVVNDVDVAINLDENTGIIYSYSTPSVSTGKKGRVASPMYYHSREDVPFVNIATRRLLSPENCSS
jgi:hypothetical protein